MAITNDDVWPVAPNFDDTTSGTSWAVVKYPSTDTIAADSSFAEVTTPLLAKYDGEKMVKCSATNIPSHIYVVGSYSGGSATFIPLGAMPYKLTKVSGGVTLGARLWTAANGEVTTSPSAGAYSVGFARENVTGDVATVLFQPWVVSEPYSA